MKQNRLVQTVSLVLILLLAACAAPSTDALSGGAPPEPTPTVFPVVGAASTETATPESNGAVEATTASADETTALSFEPALYRDESAGFELQYPAEWTLDPSSVVGVRGAQALLLSPGSSAEAVADGGSRVSIVTYVWDPKNDLEAWVAQRQTAWDASGFTIVREEDMRLSDGRTTKLFVVHAPDSDSINLLTTVGEDYLQVTGEGDFVLAEEILRTVRPLD